MLVESVVPGEDCGEDDDEEAVRDVGDAGVAGLEALLELSVRSQ